MVVTPSQLRSDVYRLLDRTLATGQPLQVKRKGRLLQIVPVAKGKKMDRLVQRPGTIIGSPDDIVHMDWSRYWKPYLPSK